METKFNQIVESYINGNISWVKSEVKKLSKENRKGLYKFYCSFADDNDNFFFNLI